VPPGFTVTTEAYAEFRRSTDLDARIASLLDGLDYDDADALEKSTAQIREVIVFSPLPDQVGSELARAYHALGSDVFVAVRSSGIAEDLADASFAGMHDTYLDLSGLDAVLDGVKRCWASLFTARATAYRAAKGFDHMAGIAVVVQTMVPSEISGVMFTANPLTGATDQIVIDASWGLGEAIVSGITTPDQFVVHAGRMQVLERSLGGKEKRVVRDPETGIGTIVEDLARADRERLSLNDDQVVELAQLGRRVQEHYGDLPQDTEWAYAGGRFYLLQSRPVTGVDLSWDADCDAWQEAPEADDAVWTRAWADEVWTGGVTPLFYSIRGRAYTLGYYSLFALCGQKALTDLKRQRAFRYYKGTIYYNCAMDRGFYANAAFPGSRALVNVPPAWHEELLNAPFSVAAYLKMQARLQLLDRRAGVLTWQKAVADEYYVKGLERAKGLTREVLARLSDSELTRYIDDMDQLETDYCVEAWPGFFLHFSQALSALAVMFAKWYDGGEVDFNKIITGAPQPTVTMIENRELWRLSEEIRHSEHLRALFDANENDKFFTACEDSDEGRRFLAKYGEFMSENGHRGHADRDLYYTRRVEDPAVDYRSLKALLSIRNSEDPHIKERAVEAERLRNVELVIANIRRGTLGALKVELFRLVLGYVTDLLMIRDDQRHWVDHVTFSMKRGFQEIGRRLVERGVLTGDRDFFFLTKTELYDLFGGRGNRARLMASIAARARNFDLVDTKQADHPMYLQRGRDADFEFNKVPGEAAAEGTFRGVGTSGGTVEGHARIVRELKDIGRVQDGDILITHSTDPGWTPVFMLLKGIVLETGGMLAHGSCLAREYGMPAVQLNRAMREIPDGARIRINGDSGSVEILDHPTESAQQETAGVTATA
jgi:pyruvate,water dikinase